MISGPTANSPQPTAMTMPSISEDEHAGEADEPPDHPSHSFAKTTPAPAALSRRPSLLTKALHTDSESHDESLGFRSTFRRQTSRSSTCSTWSARTDLMSDEASISSPTSPQKTYSFPVGGVAGRSAEEKSAAPHQSASTGHGLNSTGTSPTTVPAPTIEQKLGRKRCIMFACGRQEQQKSTEPPISTSAPIEEPAPKPEVAPKRPCALRFICPSKLSSNESGPFKRPARHASPPPPKRTGSPSPLKQQRSRPHRDSDTTVKNVSPQSMKKVPPMEPRRRASMELDREEPQENRFYEFARRDSELDDWVKESTCHKSRLTVDDTLAKEHDIQKIGEEAEEEALEEEELEDDAPDSDDDDQVSDAGFQTDDEEGFAESDDESDNDSDYDWWSARRSSPVQARMAPGDAIRLPAMHRGSASSLNSLMSPQRRDLPMMFAKSKSKPKPKAIPIRAPSPELPDSTDFVCGTLDEDKPLEEAYVLSLEKRRLARQTTNRAQDIDPTFPDEPMDLEDEEEEDDFAAVGAQDDEHDILPHGRLEDLHHHDEEDDQPDEEPRGRRREPKYLPSSESSRGHPHSSTPRTASVKRVKSPKPMRTPSRLKSPAPTVKLAAKRTKSPMPASDCAMKAAAAASAKARSATAKKGLRLCSPPPRALFGHSPRRMRSPPPTKLKSPPPSRRGSPINVKPLAFGTAFLGQRPQLTHTASLPRSPNPFAYKRAPFAAPAPEPESAGEEEDDEDTAKETPRLGYSRGAIDIVQGLEKKRLRRRQKFYEKYCRKEEKKRERGETRRPPAGKGAQRMRQVGIECAIYHGKRVLSI
ncbi:MAG: hypothetical protein Q9162_007477 [Coniocarpon cinnabarinum]